MDGRPDSSGSDGTAAAGHNVVDVLGQLPADVVDAHIWKRLHPDCRQSFALASSACANLFRATRQQCKFYNAKALEPHAAATLELYVACTRLSMNVKGGTGAWERLLTVLLQLTPIARERFRSIDVVGLAGGLRIAFTASFVACFPRLQNLHLGFIGHTPYGLLPLATLPHLSSLTVKYSYGASVAALDADVLQLARLTLLSKLVVEADIDTPEDAAALVRLTLTPLSVLRSLADLSVHIESAEEIVFQPLVTALPPNLLRLSLGGDSFFSASLDAAACDVVGRLTRLSELVTGRMQPRPCATSGRLPPTVRQLTLRWARRTYLLWCPPWSSSAAAPL